MSDNRLALDGPDGVGTLLAERSRWSGLKDPGVPGFEDMRQSAIKAIDARLASLSQGSSLASLVFDVAMRWRNQGIPEQVMEKLSPIFLAMHKGDDWPDDAEQPSVGSSGADFLVPVGDFRNLLRFRPRLLALDKNAAVLQSNRYRTEQSMIETAHAWGTGMSSVMWGDGRGAVAVGDGAFDVRGNQVAFLNSRSVHNILPGTVLRCIARQHYDESIPGEKVPVRSGSVTVKRILPGGLIELIEPSLAAAVEGAESTDVFTNDSFVLTKHFGEDVIPNKVHLMPGIFGFLALDDRTAQKMFHGVDRSVDPDRLAGRRVPLVGNESPFTIVTRILETSSDVDVIVAHPKLMQELGLELEARNIVVRNASLGAHIPRSFTMTVEVSEIRVGLRRIHLVSDPFLIDHFHAEHNDKMMVGLDLKSWSLRTTIEGIGWRDFDGNGSFVDSVRGSGGSEYYSEFWAWGAFLCKDLSGQVVARVM